MFLERDAGNLSQGLDQDPSRDAEREGLIEISQGIGAGLLITNEQYQTPIEDLFLSVRSYNCLKRNFRQRIEEGGSISYRGPVIGEVLAKSEEELLAIRNLGRGSLGEIKDRLRDFLGKDFVPKPKKEAKVEIIFAIRELTSQLPADVRLNSLKRDNLPLAESEQLSVIVDKLLRKRISTFGQLSQEPVMELLETRAFGRLRLQILKQQIARKVVLWEELQANGISQILANLTPFERTIAFLKTAIAEGAHLKKPRRIYEENWVRARNIIGSYFGSSILGPKLAKSYSVSKERVSQIIERGIGYLWENCSTATQMLFPFKEIALAKPWPQRLEAREQSSELPPVRTSIQENRQLAEELAKAKDKAKIQRLLKRVKRHFYETHTQGEQPLLIKFKDLIVGFYPSGRDYQSFLQVLDDLGIPVGQIIKRVKSGRQKGSGQNYYFIAAQNQQEAKEAFLSSPKLTRFRENPVKQITGPPETSLPRIRQLVNKAGGFIPVGQIMAEFGVHHGGFSKLIATDSFTKDCPVPIFRYRRNYFFSKDREAMLREFIARRLKELLEGLKESTVAAR